MGKDEFRDWADHVVGKIEQQRSTQLLSDQKFVAEEEAKKREAPQLWAHERQTMRDMFDALNARAGRNLLEWDSLRSTEAVVRAVDASATGIATFDPESLRVTCKFGNVSNTYSPKLLDDTVVFVESTGARQNPGEIARQFMDLIARSIR